MCLLLALLSELPNAVGTGIDVSAGAVGVAQGNAQNLGLDSRATFTVADWTEADWKEGLGAPFDMVVSNPPYIADVQYRALDREVKNFEPYRALHGGDDGLDAYRRLLPEMYMLLRHGGVGAVEVGIGQADDVVKLFSVAGFVKPETRPDLGHIQRIVLAVKPT